MMNDNNNYPLHWGGHGFELRNKEVEFNAEELLKRAKQLADSVEAKPMAADALAKAVKADLDRWISQYDERDFIEKPLEGRDKEPVIEYNESSVDDEENPYCEVCGCCGEDGCCSTEKAILAHGCKYAKLYAWEVYFNNVVTHEFYKYLDSIDARDIIDAAYDKAFKLADEKYGNKT